MYECTHTHMRAGAETERKTDTWLWENSWDLRWEVAFGLIQLSFLIQHLWEDRRPVDLFAGMQKEESTGARPECLPTVSLCFPHVRLQFHLGINFQCWAVAAHAFNLTQHLRGRGSLSLRTAWSTEQVSRQPRLYRKTLSREKKKN